MSKRASVVKGEAAKAPAAKQEKDVNQLADKAQRLSVSSSEPKATDKSATEAKDAAKSETAVVKSADKPKAESKEVATPDMTMLSEWQYVYMCLHTLLWHVNVQSKLLPNVKTMEDLNKASPAERVKLCNMLFEELATYVSSFLNDHPNFPFASQLMSWAHAVPGDFVLVKITAVGAIFVDEKTQKVYLVKALHDPFQTLLTRGKKEAGTARFRTTLIPFNRQITYNTLLVSLKDPTGTEAQTLKEMCEKAYEQAKENKTIVKFLEPFSGAVVVDEADAAGSSSSASASHGHSHNGVPCHGHNHGSNHGPIDPSKLTPEQIQMLRARHAQMQQQLAAAGGAGGHQHSHGGVPCGGHGGQHGHSHSHGGGESHGHSHAGGDHGHSHAEGDHGHSHAEGDHGHSHAGGDHGHSHSHGGDDADEEEEDHHGHSHAGGDHGHSHAGGDHGHSHAGGDHGHSHSHGGHSRSASQASPSTAPAANPTAASTASSKADATRKPEQAKSKPEAKNKKSN